MKSRAVSTTIALLRNRNRSINLERDTMTALAQDIDRHGAARRSGLRQRLSEVVRALGPGRPVQSAGTETILQALSQVLTPLTADRAWLTLAVLSGELPDSDKVRAAVRTSRTDGLVAALRLAIWSGPLPRVLDQGPFREVVVIQDVVLVDVHHTAQTDFATGIQRVTREITRRWLPKHHPTLVGWSPDLRSIRRLTPAEVRRACWGGPAVQVPTDDQILVPWHCTYVVPELAAEPERSGALQALAQFSGSTLNLVGYDLVPITTAETSEAGMLVSFARGLSAARHARVVVPISQGAGVEYRGWRGMLAGTGLPGPAIEVVPLAVQAPPDNPAGTAMARDRLQLGSLPMVLVVGSHEPRKNHLAVLHAAELLWRAGLQFTLTLVGGNAWNSERFFAALERLQLSGRPVETLAAASDELLFGAYRAARFTLFPSLNEGFGLPVAESLACGTPVITSSFGSMKEIVDAGGGGLLVDPRNDHSIAEAMRRLLTDDALLAQLSEQARARPERTWDTYADETWQILTQGPTPDPVSADGEPR